MNPEALLDTLLAELNEGVVACEPDGRVMLFNRAAAELLGRDRPLRRGSSIYRVFFLPGLEWRVPLSFSLRIFQPGMFPATHSC
jgi:PAS domain-containing protein